MPVTSALEAYNCFVSESVVLLDSCTRPGPLLPGAVGLDSALPPAEAARVAYLRALEEFVPDNRSTAILFEDEEDEGRGAEVESWLRGEEDACRRMDRVLRVRREDFAERYGFLLVGRGEQ